MGGDRPVQTEGSQLCRSPSSARQRRQGSSQLLHPGRPSVTLTASNPDNARAAATQTGARAADSNRQAIGTAEVVMLAVQYPAVDTILAEPATPWTARC
jgi:predicted dinucleotide-binding enzyme